VAAFAAAFAFAFARYALPAATAACATPDEAAGAPSPVGATAPTEGSRLVLTEDPRALDVPEALPGRARKGLAPLTGATAPVLVEATASTLGTPALDLDRRSPEATASGADDPALDRERPWEPPLPGAFAPCFGSPPEDA